MAEAGASTAQAEEPAVTEQPAEPAARQGAEPVAPEPAVEAIAPELPGEAAASSVDDDLFAQASRVFESAVFESAEVPKAPADAIFGDIGEAAGVEAAPRRARSTFVRKAAATGSTFVVMGVTGLLAVSMTLPYEAVAAVQGAHGFAPAAQTSLALADTPTIDEGEIQAFVAPEDVVASTIERAAEDYSTVSLIDLAAAEGIRYSDSVFTNDPNAAIQWPFIVGVPVTSRYGMRWGRMHEGIDMVPGSGAPIQAIADGVVRIASEAGGAYGVHVWIDHEIDGKRVSSHYAHMRYGSLKVRAGQQVKVGDILGNVGNTGRSYGAHLHFEIEVNGTKVDPLPFMNKYAGTY